MFPVTITIHNLDDLNRVTAALTSNAQTPKSSAAATQQAAASGTTTVKDGAARTETAADKTRTAASAADKSQASTAADAKKQKGEPEQGAAQSAGSATAGTTGSSFRVVRDAILARSTTHKDAIKAINAKHGIGKLSDLLEVSTDFDSAVKDQAKLDAIHHDVLQLGA